MMTLDQFTELLDLHGADLSRWPQDKIKPALALVEHDAAARRAFDQMLSLEDHLRHAPMPDVDLAALENRIMAAINTPETASESAVIAAAATAAPKGFFRWRAAFMVAPPVGLMAVAVFGFMLGMQPSLQRESLVHPVYYQADQILSDDASIYQGRIF